MSTRRIRMRPLPAPPGPPPTVTVVVPCFNYGHFLPDAVGSALDQEDVDVEVVVVDDASTDGSADVAERLAAGDPRVSLIRHHENLGPVRTFNDGLAAVRGEFLVRLDADDLLAPGALARATAAANHHPSVGLVYGRPRHFAASTVPDDLRTDVRHWVVWPGRLWLANRCRDALNVITSPEVVMRSSVVRQVGGQLPIRHAHDMEMWFRLAAASDVLYLRGPDQALHRDHRGSLSTQMTGVLDDVRERREAFDVLFSGPAGDLPDAEVLHTAARTAMARQALTSAAHEYDRGRPDTALTEESFLFAEATDPRARGSRAWSGLERRVVLGRDGVRRRPWYAASARGRRVRSLVRHQIWRRSGTYDGR